ALVATISAHGGPVADAQGRRKPFSDRAERGGSAARCAGRRECRRAYGAVQQGAPRAIPRARLEHEARAPSLRIRRQKKRCRPLESLRPDVILKRQSFLRKVAKISIDRLVFLDEAGLNCSMTRSHAWVKRGSVYEERVPMNWGKNLTLIGAIRIRGWITLGTMFATANRERFVRWLRVRLLPKLRRGDVLVMDNATAHHAPQVANLCEAAGV